MDLVKARRRVIDHGEVFTPSWMVDSMLDLVKRESRRIDSRFLEPACGSGNFLVSVLSRKLETVRSNYEKSEFESRHQALLALMCIYGIELLSDNVAECRSNLLHVFTEFLNVDSHDTWYKAGREVLSINIAHGDALTMTRSNGQGLIFPEWAYIGKGRYQRRDFRYDALTQMSSFGKDTLFGGVDKHEIFVPVEEYPRMSVEEIARG